MNNLFTPARCKPLTLLTITYYSALALGASLFNLSELALPGGLAKSLMNAFIIANGVMFMLTGSAIIMHFATSKASELKQMLFLRGTGAYCPALIEILGLQLLILALGITIFAFVPNSWFAVLFLSPLLVLGPVAALVYYCVPLRE